MKCVYKILLQGHHYLEFYYFRRLLEVVSEFIDFIISSKDISASQRLKCSLDIFFLIGILQTNSLVAAVEVHLV